MRLRQEPDAPVRSEARTVDAATMFQVKTPVIFSMSAEDLANLSNWPEFLAMAAMSPRAMHVAVVGKGNARAEARAKELSCFVKVYGDEQLAFLPQHAPIFHFSDVGADAAAVSASMTRKLGRGIKALIGIAPGSFLLPGALLDQQVEVAMLPKKNGFLLAGERFAERLAVLFQSFTVITSAA